MSKQGYYKFKLKDGKWVRTGLVPCKAMENLKRNNPQLEITKLNQSIKEKIMKHFLLTISLLFLAGCSCTGVVGVAYNQDDVVRYVFKGSPAESIGVKSGDKIVDSSKLTGEVGTMATFEIIRDSKTYKKRAKRVCVDTLSYEKPTQW